MRFKSKILSFFKSTIEVTRCPIAIGLIYVSDKPNYRVYKCFKLEIVEERFKRLSVPRLFLRHPNPSRAKVNHFNYLYFLIKFKSLLIEVIPILFSLRLILSPFKPSTF